jgi:hypothetical protein
MSRIPMHVRGSKPRFFPAEGADELVSMVLEMATELWAVKERMYALERVVSGAGLDVPRAIEAWQPGEAERTELDTERARMVQTILRSLEARYVDRSRVQEQIDSGADPVAPPAASRAA